ncbi:hypothetical protein PMAYCL1PPCAC_01938, partial [Pristionchus mayeri]
QLLIFQKMCSFLVQIIYGVVCLASTAMTVVAMAMPGEWATNDNTIHAMQNVARSMYGVVDEWSSSDLPWTEKVVVACMCIGLAFQVVAFIWNIISICACCCKRFILHPLSLFTLLAAIFLAIAVAFYAIFDGSFIEIDPKNPFSVTKDDASLEMGYCFWLACGALALNVVNMIVASAAICCAKGCC